MTSVTMIDGATMLRCRAFENRFRRLLFLLFTTSMVFRLCPSRFGDMLYHFGKLLPYLMSLPFPNITCTPTLYSRSCRTYIHFT